jgi:hypothetical protein
MRGRSIPLSLPRRLIGDLMYFSAGVPTVPVQRTLNLSKVIDARDAHPDRPCWPAVFTRAFALVAAEMPELRRTYLKYPWPRLYEYPVSVANVLIEREYEGEKAVFTLRMMKPELSSIIELSQRIRHAAVCPIEEIKEFRRAIRLGRHPRPVRRFLWWLALNLPRARPNYFGTFGISSYSALGAESLHPLSPLTVTLNYGVFAADGSVDVRLIYDHRVLDGANVARALARLDAILNTTILDELRKP